ncbi:hypothetical protein B0H19DRAFT_1086312 [Mycena capillaripes]|nr:hypothetical protein B0H19DRAFT_1086312 [Mycena capillaripes]
MMVVVEGESNGAMVEGCARGADGGVLRVRVREEDNNDDDDDELDEELDIPSPPRTPDLLEDRPKSLLSQNSDNNDSSSSSSTSSESDTERGEGDEKEEESEDKPNIGPEDGAGELEDEVDEGYAPL